MRMKNTAQVIDRQTLAGDSETNDGSKHTAGNKWLKQQVPEGFSGHVLSSLHLVGAIGQHETNQARERV